MVDGQIIQALVEAVPEWQTCPTLGARCSERGSTIMWVILITLRAPDILPPVDSSSYSFSEP